jgi:hypothetical protein
VLDASRRCSPSAATSTRRGRDRGSSAAVPSPRSHRRGHAGADDNAAAAIAADPLQHAVPSSFEVAAAKGRGRRARHRRGHAGALGLEVVASALGQ